MVDSSVFPHAGAEHMPPRSNFVYRVGRQGVRKVMASYEEGIRHWNAKERAKFRGYQSFQDQLITEPGRTWEIVWAELQELRAERAVHARTEPHLETAYAVLEGEPRDSAIHVAGDPKTPGATVRRGFLQILDGAKAPPEHSGSGRRLLADWIADPQSRLTAG